MEKILKNMVLTNWALAVAGVVIETGLLVAYRNSLPPQVPLLYTRPWGDEQLAISGWLWAIPITQLTIGVVGGWFFKTRREEILLKTAVMVTLVVIQIILILGFTRILSLVI